MNCISLKKLLDLENDGSNIAVDGQFLYIRCKKAMCKYSLKDMSLTAHNDIFKKDGKARSFSICDKHIFLTDFCDLYILDKETMQSIEVIRLGADLSSDLGSVRFDSQKAYICIRNGKIAVMNMSTREYEKYDIINSSYWDHCVVENRLYAGTVQRELFGVDTGSMKVNRQTALGKKNIYSVVLHGNLIYTVSQDMTIKATNVDSFGVACVAKKAVRGMAKILGIYKSILSLQIQIKSHFGISRHYSYVMLSIFLPGSLIKVWHWMETDCLAVIIKAYITWNWSEIWITMCFNGLSKKYPCSNISHTDGKSVLRLISSDKPYPTAQAAEPNMEDLYLFCFEDAKP